MVEKLTVGRLSKKQRDQIYALIDNKTVGYRAKIISLSYDGYGVSEIYSKLNVHPNVVRKWIKRFKEYGVKGIMERKRGGRKPLIDKKVEEKIFKIATTRPEDLNLVFSTWSLRKLREYLIKSRVVKNISHTEVMRILKANGLQFKRTKRELLSRDAEYEIKKRRIQRLLKKPNCIVLYEDEKIVVAKRYPGYEWCFKAKVVEKNQKIHGKAIMFGCYDPHHRKLYYKLFDRLTKDNFRRFLDYIDKKFDEDVYVILDNHKSHNLSENKRYKRFKFMFLPKHAPKLNMMDTYFSVISREVLQNRVFKSIKKMNLAIRRWIACFNKRCNS